MPGGVIGSVAGKKFSLWFESQEKMKFSNFYEETNLTSAEDNVVDGGKGTFAQSF